MSKARRLVYVTALMSFVSLYAARDHVVSSSFSFVRPYSFGTNPSSLNFTEDKLFFAFELAWGEHAFSHLFPWPRAQAYWRFRQKQFGGFVALIDRFQYTIRDETLFIDSYGQPVGTGRVWLSSLIYSLRLGTWYTPHHCLVIGIGGDINYGLRRFDTDPPTGSDFGEYSEVYSGYATSYSTGITIVSADKKQMLSVGYDSRIVVILNDPYIVPHQVSVSAKLQFSPVVVGVDYYRRFTQYKVANDCENYTGSISSDNFAIDLTLPIWQNDRLYVALYSVPLGYYESGIATSAEFGIGLGLRLDKKKFLRHVLLTYEHGNAAVWLSDWQYRKYGIHLAVAF